jgi:hypothetical protein
MATFFKFVTDIVHPKTGAILAHRDTVLSAERLGALARKHSISVLPGYVVFTATERAANAIASTLPSAQSE